MGSRMKFETMGSLTTSDSHTDQSNNIELSHTERSVVRKVDWHILPILSLMYTFSYLDRVNIGLARLFGLEESLNLTSSQYATVLSIFFLGYMLFEIPSNLMIKLTSPSIWFAIILTSWGGSTLLMATSSNFSELLAARLLLGIFEAGLFPGIIFYLSFWYPRHEQGTRISILCSATSIAGSLGGLIAYSIHFLDNAAGIESWRWLFFLEGLPTTLLGLSIWWLIPNTPQDAKFLTSEERDSLVKRLKASQIELDISYFNWDQLRKIILDPRLYLFMILNLSIMIPGNSTGLLLPSLVNSLGFSPAMSTLLTVPIGLASAIISITAAWHSDRVMERSFHLIGSICFTIFGFILVMCVEIVSIRYFALLIICSGISCCISLTLSWLNNTFLGSTTSSIAPAAVLMTGCFGGMIAGQLYFIEDAPYYFISHGLNIASLCLSITCVLLIRYMMTRDNYRFINNSVEPLSSSTPLLLPTDNSGYQTFRYVL